MMNTKRNQVIGARIKEARELAGYRFAIDAASRLNMHVQNVRDQEAGRRTASVDHLVKYSKVYKCSIDWLATGKGGPQGHERGSEPIFAELSDSDYEAVLEFARFKAKSAA